ncbi:2-oxoglutarate-dependent dioxygenase 19-like [Cornus florida]|uniref:2-oxoglutarate-dependent dioxygenase 19-like n=1 Tax=Cornus florida TaxID=4283 RepID=UPI0028A19106|nr:2-oxoglutarate-dependent dioxygenase 19-like [Cornus florida]
MATTSSMVPQPSPKTPLHTPELTCIKSLAESGALTSIPSNYAYSTMNPNESAGSDSEESIPVIDFSLLTSDDPDQRSKIVQDLGKACREWGFFMVINHDVPVTLMKRVIDACNEFFNLAEDEKREYKGKHVLDPIRCGTSFNATAEKVFFWRDFLKVHVHPHFHFPNKPMGFSELSLEYCDRTRKVASELLKGISESLGLEKSYIHKTLNLDSGFQIFVANLYPPCPQPDQAMGLPPHSDHGLLTLLIENRIVGLQVQHNSKFVNVNAPPNSFLVNTGDHLEILSNGKYKSNVHRAVVNNKATRISLAMAHGPALDAVVGPATELVNRETHPAAYIPMKYVEFMELQQSNQLDGKSVLDRVRVQTV